MVAAYVAEIERSISTPRLARYQPPGGTLLDAAFDYFWNMALAEAFYPLLSGLEVALRNSLHDTLTVHYQTDRWFAKSTFLSQSTQQSSYYGTLQKLQPTYGPQPSAGRMIAEFHFSYWTTLLNRSYHQLLWNPNRAALLRTVFPWLSGPGFRRDLIFGRYNTIRLFRNRVFHYEPILNGLVLPRQAPVSLTNMHDQILEALGWLNPTLEASLAVLDHYPSIAAAGRTTIEQTI